MDCQERLLTQAKMIKDRKTGTKVMVYRNLVKALPWYSSVRDKLTDPQYAGFFLKFNCNASAEGAKYPGGCHVPREDTPFYHDQEQTPHGPTCGHAPGPSPCCGVPCGEYLVSTWQSYLDRIILV